MCLIHESASDLLVQSYNASQNPGGAFKATYYYQGGRFELSSIPKGELMGYVCVEGHSGLPGYAISTKLWVEPKYRGTSTIKVLDAMRDAVAKASGYKFLMASARADNPVELARLFKNDWKNLHHCPGDPDHLLFVKEL